MAKLNAYTFDKMCARGLGHNAKAKVSIYGDTYLGNVAKFMTTMGA